MPYQSILLIDDDEDDREIFVSALQMVSDSAQCITFSDARIALDRLFLQEFTPDLIFLDLNMPYMNGQEFLTEIKKNERLAQIPVVILSTSSNARSIEETKKLGAKDFLTKPDKFEDLITILTSVLK